MLILAITCPINKVDLFSTVFYSTIFNGVDISVSSATSCTLLFIKHPGRTGGGGGGCDVHRTSHS